MSMRLPPRSLRWRLLLLLVGGLATAQTISAIISYYDRKVAIERVVARRHAQRVVDMVHMLDALSAEDRARVAAAVRNPVVALGNARLAPDLEATIRPAGANARTGGHLVNATVSGLRERLQPPRIAQVAVDETVMRFVMDANGLVGGARDPNGWAVVLRSTLRDGTPFSAYVEVPFPAPFPLQSLAEHLVAICVITAVLVTLGVRWVTRPLSQLADAAERLGNDLRAPPLKETGASELRRAARAFNSMQERLARYLNSRVSALSAISHDLKTPLTRMRLRSEMIDEPGARAAMLRDVAELEAMVGSALDFIRGLESSEAIQPTDINALLESVCEDLREVGHTIVLSGRAGTPYPAQPQALKRCLANLVENACKYGERAHVTIEDHPRELVIRIDDEGPGVPAGELEKVFEPFYRLESSRSRDTGGTGLGLPIARNVAQAHAGQVRLVNRPGGGLEATLALPRI